MSVKLTMPEKYDNIIRMAKREERERILGIIEFYRDHLGDSAYENYVKKKLTNLVEVIERNE